MLVHLMQHGACLPKEADPEQPLSPVGIDLIRRNAISMRSLGMDFDRIITSNKLRALQSAEIVAKTIGYPVEGIAADTRFKPSARPEKSLEALEEYAAELVLVVGHLPSLEHLASRLLGGADGVRLHFANGGLTCIETSPTFSQSVLHWHLQPRHLSLLGN
ncbi:SixA phosphatase family protein [Desulfovibrio oxyclinae]|uniref:SixA phosphatase family protein n=1 Tax=Desulfovibrio oxyclinae TaxID=63560 RepID=UPI00035CC0A2|nr:histidine phosphatase family protein [Desulfovibrio oxyclinae]